MGTKKICLFNQPGLGDNGGDQGFSENPVEAQYADAESGDSWGSRRHSEGVMDADGTDLFNIRPFVFCY
jgi:hypothetical protein